MRKRFGDTLVEVTLAIGIFSMVAIAVVSVVSGSTSDAQASLELTVTREAIDAQAESLRFIHNSYVTGTRSDISSADTNVLIRQKYAAIWKAITERAIPESDIGAYLPRTCAELYSDETFLRHAFVIDTRNLALGNNESNFSIQNNLSRIFLTPTEDGTSKFKPASTYPRLVYGESSGVNDSLLDDTADADIFAVEGLFIIPTKDVGTTIVSSNEGNTDSAYYDFFIRSCWFAPGSERPSTISTVVRLYDPDTVPDYTPVEKYNLTLVVDGQAKSESYNAGTTIEVSRLQPTNVPEDKMFICWNMVNGSTYVDDERYCDKRIRSITLNKDTTLYAVLAEKRTDWMQYYTMDRCISEASGQNVYLQDIRDNNRYSVKYVNGVCWMTEDLKTNGSINSYSSNFYSKNPFNTNVSPAKTISNSGYVWYNACAVSGGVGGWCEKNNQQHASADYSSDICPAGWHVPNPGVFASAVNGTNISLSNKGYYWNGNLVTDNTFWWISASGDMNAMQYAAMNQNNIITESSGQGGLNKDALALIRCVLR